jgi:hypothetical protein
MLARRPASTYGHKGRSCVNGSPKIQSMTLEKHDHLLKSFFVDRDTRSCETSLYK